MNKRGAGVMFCLIAALLFAARYIAAAFVVINNSMYEEAFAMGLECQGSGLIGSAAVSLAAGIIYLVWAEIEERRR